MWAAILAGWISALLQAITGYDQHTGRAHAARLRRDLLLVPGRLVRHAGQPILSRQRSSTALLADVGQKVRLSQVMVIGMGLVISGGPLASSFMKVPRCL